MKLNTHRQFFFSLLFIIPTMLLAGNETEPGSLESYSTIYSIGFEWNIEGDDNHNASCNVQYRISGSTIWLPAMPLYRVDFEGYNMLAGSILFLEPGTTYEVQLMLSDPDGGESTLIEMVTTRMVPVMPSGGNSYHVIPGNGGGDGSENNPFQGIEAAEAVAQPGDIFLLHAGNYGGVIFLNSGGTPNNHVVWKAFNNESPTFEGIRIESDYIWLDGLTVIDQQYGLRTSPPGPIGINITHCTFIKNHYSIYLNDGGADWYIADNIIIGDNDPNLSDFSGEGIELWYTEGHTVAHNKISRTADGISYPHSNVDIFGNEIFDTSDDGIEGDYGHANIRIWGNRITNPRNNGISFQPMDGSPWYVLYNQVAVLDESVMKLRTRSDRALIAHNTFVAQSGPIGFGTGYLRNMEVKNNLWISVKDRYVWEESQDVNQIINWKTDFDYNGFDWGNYPYAFKWDNTKLVDIAEFNQLTGQEEHGVKIDQTTCFDSLNYTGLVDSFFIEYQILNPNCNAIDAGIVLPNINDDFTGNAPDLGAYEYGQALPVYGPRSDVINHSASINPLSFELKQNYPNPVSGYTSINYSVSSQSEIDLSLYDLMGNKITTLFKGIKPAGNHQFIWNRNMNTHLPPGLYFYVMTIDKQQQTRKMIVGRD